MRLVATSTSTWSTQSTTSWRLQLYCPPLWYPHGLDGKGEILTQQEILWMISAVGCTFLQSINSLLCQSSYFLPLSIFLPRKQHQLSFAWFYLLVKSNCFSSLYEANANYVDKFRFFSINQLLNFIHLLAILDSSNFVHFHFFSFDFS